MKRGHRTGKPKGGFPHLYGRHAVIAALANPNRVIRKIWGTREVINALELPPMLPIVYSDVADMARYVPHDAPHQGIVVHRIRASSRRSNRWMISGWATCWRRVRRTRRRGARSWCLIR